MARLSKHDREQIASKYVAAKFDALDAAHRARAVELAEAALVEFYGSRQLETFRSLSKLFHCETTTIEFQCTETGRVGNVQVPTAIVVPNATRRCKVDRTLADEMCAWMDERKRLVDDRRDLVLKTRGVLEALGTPARVRAEWPAIAEYLPEPESAKPLAVLPSSIDAAIEHATTPAPTRPAR